jgi:hypothetical protein
MPFREESFSSAVLAHLSRQQQSDTQLYNVLEFEAPTAPAWALYTRKPRNLRVQCRREAAVVALDAVRCVSLPGAA